MLHLHSLDGKLTVDKRSSREERRGSETREGLLWREDVQRGSQLLLPPATVVQEKGREVKKGVRELGASSVPQSWGVSVGQSLRHELIDLWFCVVVHLNKIIVFFFLIFWLSGDLSWIVRSIVSPLSHLLLQH